jgi:glycosyltransferase involved in cell wall biosynthesis
VLVVGTLEARKGHDVLLRAVACRRGDEFRVVFAGADPGRSSEIWALARQLGVADRLILLGRVSDSTLAGLYRDALMLCLPSLAEGFGLPVVEAMAAGLPVVASDLPAIREVTSGNAVLVPPGDVEALADAVTRLIADRDLRNRLAELGPPRAHSFSWEAAAGATVNAYRAALGLAD